MAIEIFPTVGGKSLKLRTFRNLAIGNFVVKVDSYVIYQGVEIICLTAMQITLSGAK